jgi:hypothetical protein
MQNKEYSEIREKNNFLVLYFNRHSNIKLTETEFYKYYQLWLFRNYGLGINHGTIKIIKFLDSKFGYVKNNT